MELKEYINQVIDQFIDAHGYEVPWTRELEFDIGIDHEGNRITVQQGSQNRIRFTLEVKRS